MKSLAFFDPNTINDFIGKKTLIEDIVTPQIQRIQGGELIEWMPTVVCPIIENFYNYDVDPLDFHSKLTNSGGRPFEGNWTDAFYVLKRFMYKEGLEQGERDGLDGIMKHSTTRIIFVGTEKTGNMIQADVVITTDMVYPKGYKMPVRKWGIHEFLRYLIRVRKRHLVQIANEKLSWCSSE